MNRSLLLLILLFVLAVGMVVTPAKGYCAVVWELGLDQRTKDTIPGRLDVEPDGSKAWRSSLRVITAKNSFDALPQFAIGGILNPNSGAIEFTLTRDNLIRGEALATFEDVDGNNLLSIYIYWDGFAQSKFSEIVFERGKGIASPVYQSSVLNPNQGPNPTIFESVPLEITVGKGDTVEIGLTWGPLPGDYNVFCDGRPLNPIAQQPFGMAEVIEQAATLVIGSETDRKWNEASNPLNSLLKKLRIFDTPDYQKPIITSITHDAFAVAGMSGKLVAGDTVTVVEKADPGGKASFDIVRPASTSGRKTSPGKVIVSGIAMTESADNPGSYTGSYTVRYGDEVTDGQVVGRFSNAFGVDADPLAAAKPISIDGTVHLAVNPSNDLIPADESSRSGLTIVASDANGKHVKDHPLKLTMSTTDEYTGTVGGGTFEDNVGGRMEVDWRGITDSFGEVTAQYISGFAAKTILVSAKDMATGDVGVGYVRAYIDGTVDIVVKRPAAAAQAISGSMEVSASRDWLTADGKSRSRITVVVRDASGDPVEGDNVSFNLLGDIGSKRRGSIRVIRSRTDSRGRATADYIAGTVMGQVQIEVRDMTSGLVSMIAIELRPDAPAEISLTADPGEIYIGGKGSAITAKVTDVNGNPNADTDVLFEVIRGGGSVSAPAAVTESRHGIASVEFLPGKDPGVSTIKGTVISRPATDKEIAAAKGAVFLYGLADDPGRLEVTEWFAKPGDEVSERQDLVTLEDRHGETYTVKAPRDGVLATFVAEERDRVEYGQTLGYVLPLEE